MHGIYLNTQLKTIYIDINIVEIDKGKTCDEAENKKNAFYTFIF